jgi:hypothetical protein
MDTKANMTTPEPNIAEQRGRMIKLLEDALMLADDLDDGKTGYLIERSDKRRCSLAIYTISLF